MNLKRSSAANSQARSPSAGVAAGETVTVLSDGLVPAQAPQYPIDDHVQLRIIRISRVMVCVFNVGVHVYWFTGGVSSLCVGRVDDAFDALGGAR
jgi:hypothetical protein